MWRWPSTYRMTVQIRGFSFIIQPLSITTTSGAGWPNKNTFKSNGHHGAEMTAEGLTARFDKICGWCRSCLDLLSQPLTVTLDVSNDRTNSRVFIHNTATVYNLDTTAPKWPQKALRPDSIRYVADVDQERTVTQQSIHHTRFIVWIHGAFVLAENYVIKGVWG
jgi:hypothetical protein